MIWSIFNMVEIFQLQLHKSSAVPLYQQLAGH